MTITTFNRNNVAQLQNEVKAAIALIAERHGIKIEMGRGSFSANAFTLKVEGAVVTSDGTAMTREAEAFRQLASLYGLRPEDLGRSIPFQGGTANIIGLKSRASRMPIVLQDENGKTWKTSAENVQFLLSRANAA
jgi:hypothetical protein